MRLRRTLIVVALVLAPGALLLGVLPLVAAAYAERWLAAQGAEGARVADVDFNPFTGVARVTGLEAGDGAAARLRVGLAEVDVRWWPLTERRVHVQRLRLEDAEVDVRLADGDWQVGGLRFTPGVDADTPPADAAAAAAAWGFGSDELQIRGVEVTYRDGLLDKVVEIRELSLGEQFTWEQNRVTPLTLDMAVDGAPLVLETVLTPWSEAPSLSGSVTLEELKLADYASLLEAAAGLAAPSGQVSLDLEVSLSRASSGGLRLSASGPVAVTGLGLTRDGMTLRQESLRWQGEVAVNLPAPADGALLRVNGALSLAGSAADLPAPAMTAHLDTLAWQGELAVLGNGGGSPQFAGVSALSIAGLRAKLVDPGLEVVAVEHLELRGLAPQSADQAATDQLDVRGLSLLVQGAAAPVLAVEGLAVSDVVLRGRDLAAATVRLDGPRLRAAREASGDIGGVATLLSAFGPAPGEESGEAEAAAGDDLAAPFAFRVNTLTLRGEQWLEVVDRSVSPPARFQLDTLDLTLTDIDSSAAAGPMTLRLGTGDGSLSLAVEGRLQAFGETRSADLTVDLDALDLTRISPYLPGYHIERGRLSSDSTVGLEGDTLDVNNKLVIEGLKLSGKAVAEGVLAQGLAMPVDVALDLLRDRQDRIRLTLPVTGSLADPKFGTGDVVRLAMQRALQNAALSYVKNALQPLGTLLLVGNLAAQAARPRFEPVAMTAGSAEVPDGAVAYLGKLGNLLVERPGLRLTVCGVAAPADRAALEEAALQEAAREAAGGVSGKVAGADDAPAPDREPATDGVAAPAVAPVRDEALLELARLRTTAVITRLTRRDGVERERLFACRETLDTSDGAQPRVEVTL